MNRAGAMLVMLAAMLAPLLAATPLLAQGVVFANSDAVVTIHSNFAGETMTLFGNVEGGQGAVPETGPYEVVIVVRGPASNRVVRLRERQFGLFLNTEFAAYGQLPGYYAVLSSRPIGELLNPGPLSDPRMSLHNVVAQARTQGDGARFDPELIRLMTRAGLFIEQPRGVSFLSPTTFAARIPLPSNVPNGLFIAQAFVIVDGDVAGTRSTSFVVRTEGFERFVYRTAVNNPLIYGLAAVAIALITGWIGGVLFRR